MQTQKPWIAASGMAIGALAIMAGVVFWSKGELSAQAQGTPVKPGQKAAPTGQKPPAPKGQKPTPGGVKANPAPQKGGIFAPPAAGVAAGGMKGAPGAAAGQPGTAPKVAYRPPYNPRRDPFALIWKIPPPPPYVFNEVQPVRVASVNVALPPSTPIEIREVPSRRVSGIMSGDGVFAILEGVDGDPEIVKPGAETRDGYKVVAISAETVTLRKKEGNVTRTQIVPLSDIPPGQQVQGGGGGRFGGGPTGGGPSAAGTSGFGGGRGAGRGGGGQTGGAKE